MIQIHDLNRMRSPVVLQAMLFLIVIGAVAHSAWATEELASRRAVFRYSAHGKRDPFLPLVREGRIVSIEGTAHADPSAMVLRGIVWDPHGQSIALIDDTEVKVGDAIGAYHVTEIREDAVVLTNGGEPIVLRIAFDALPSGVSSRSTMGGEGR